MKKEKTPQVLFLSLRRRRRRSKERTACLCFFPFRLSSFEKLHMKDERKKDQKQRTKKLGEGTSKSLWRYLVPSTYLLGNKDKCKQST
jgi:hypothetical protein